MARGNCDAPESHYDAGSGVTCCCTRGFWPITIATSFVTAVVLCFISHSSVGWLVWRLEHLALSTPPSRSKLDLEDLKQLRQVTLQEKTAWRKAGFVVLKSALNPKVIDELLAESERLCWWQLMFSKVCQIDETRWLSDVFRDFLFHGPLGSIVSSVIGGGIRVYADGIVAFRSSFVLPFAETFTLHVDHSGLPGKFGGLHSDTIGASAWIALQDLDNETDGGGVQLFDGFVNLGCHFLHGEVPTMPKVLKELNGQRLMTTCRDADEGDISGEGVQVLNFKATRPSVRKGDIILWHPSMMYSSEPLKAWLTRYAYHVRLVRNDSISCFPKACGYGSFGPCCKLNLSDAGTSIDTPCYPQVHPHTLEEEVAAHLKAEPLPLVDRQAMTHYYQRHSQLWSGATAACLLPTRPPTQVELSWNKPSRAYEMFMNLMKAEQGSNATKTACIEQLELLTNRREIEESECFTVTFAKGLTVFQTTDYVNWQPRLDLFIPTGADILAYVDPIVGFRIPHESDILAINIAHVKLKPLCELGHLDQCTEAQLSASRPFRTLPLSTLHPRILQTTRRLDGLLKEHLALKTTADAELAASSLEKANALQPESVQGLPFSLEGMTAWYGSWDAGPEWPSIVGNHKLRVLSGFVEVGHELRQGAAQFLRGDTSAKVDFGPIIETNFTICSATRYDGTHYGRILQGKDHMWYHGHNDGYWGAASYHDQATAPRGWARANPGDTRFSHDWLVMCGTNLPPMRILVNGSKRGIQAPRHPGDERVYINSGHIDDDDAYVGMDSGLPLTSDWAIAELMTWNRDLPEEEMVNVSRYLMGVVQGLALDAKDMSKLAPGLSSVRVAMDLHNVISDNVTRKLAIIQEQKQTELERHRNESYTLQLMAWRHKHNTTWRGQCGPTNPLFCHNSERKRVRRMVSLSHEELVKVKAFEEARFRNVTATVLDPLREQTLAGWHHMTVRRNDATNIEGMPIPGRGLVSWFRSEDLDETTVRWQSRVGNFTGVPVAGSAMSEWRPKYDDRGHLVAEEVAASPSLEVDADAGHGAIATVKYLRGQYTDGYQFGQILRENYTLCSISRFGGNNKRIILKGLEVPLQHGHLMGTAGVAGYRGRFITERPPDGTGAEDWVVMCATNSPNRVYFNGLDVTMVDKTIDTSREEGVNITIAINVAMDFGGSDWCVMEVISWDRALSKKEMDQAANYLLGKLDGDGVANYSLIDPGLAGLRQLDEQLEQERATHWDDLSQITARYAPLEQTIRDLDTAIMYRDMEAETCGPARLEKCTEEQNATLNRYADLTLQEAQHLADLSGYKAFLTRAEAGRIASLGGRIEPLFEQNELNAYSAYELWGKAYWHAARLELAPSRLTNTSDEWLQQVSQELQELREREFERSAPSYLVYGHSCMGSIGIGMRQDDSSIDVAEWRVATAAGDAAQSECEALCSQRIECVAYEWYVQKYKEHHCHLIVESNGTIWIAIRPKGTRLGELTQDQPARCYIKDDFTNKADIMQNLFKGGAPEVKDDTESGSSDAPDDTESGSSDAPRSAPGASDASDASGTQQAAPTPAPAQEGLSALASIAARVFGQPSAPSESTMPRPDVAAAGSDEL